MRLISLILYTRGKEGPVEVFSTSNLEFASWFFRNQLRENIRFQSHLVAGRTKDGTKRSVAFDEAGFQCHAWMDPQGFGGVVIADSEYPQRVAFAFLLEAARTFSERVAGDWRGAAKDMSLQCPEVDALFHRFQSPSEADKLTKLQQDLDDVKGVVMESMDALLARGEKLDSLIEKTDKLSTHSKEFRRMAERNNSWCDWLRRLLLGS